jgi:hypothetical protein
LERLSGRRMQTARRKSGSRPPCVSSATTNPCVAPWCVFPAPNGRARRSSLVPSVVELPEDFRDLLVELCEAKAEFLLIGGWAVVLYGHVRATDDLDIFVRASPENSARVYAALEAFGAPLRAHRVEVSHFANEGQAYRFGVAPLKIEVLTQISGVSFDEALEGSKAMPLGRHSVPYIGKAALIANKKSAGRNKDLADVEELEQVKD